MRMKEKHVKEASVKPSTEGDKKMVCSMPLDNVGFD